MTVKAYIEQKLQQFDIKLSEADFSDLCDTGLSLTEEKSADNVEAIKFFMLRMVKEKIDSLPMSKSEGDMSVSYQDRMCSFYDTLCRDLGVYNVFSKKPKITFL